MMNYGFYISSEFIFFMMNFELVPGTCFFTVSKGHSLEKMVGTNGKVGPNPRFVSIEYT